MPDRTEHQKEVIRTDSSSETHVTDAYKTDIGIFLDQTLRTNPFGHNLSGGHVYKRAERIAAAIHLLTAHIPSDEPVRERVREESITLLHLALELRSELRALGSEIFKKTQASIRTLISLARLLGISGFASVQNTQILVDALDELGNLLLTSQRSALSEDTPLTRDELMPRRGEFSGDVAPTPKSRHPSGPADKKRRSIKDNVKDAGGLSHSVGMRAERILDILRSGGTLGIRDIASNLPEYSEKMIQRELAILVSMGKVNKIGAKRWSKYSVI